MPPARLPAGFVTFLMTDVEGSTRLWETASQAMATAIQRHNAIIEEIVDAHHGVLLKSKGEGDSTFSVFGDSRAAIRSAAAVQRRFLAESWPEPAELRVRIAVHATEMNPVDDDYFGPEVNRCARLRAIGHGGQILFSESVRVRLSDEVDAGVEILDQGSHRLKDLERPERVYELKLAGSDRQFPPLRSLDARRHNLPVQPTSFVGRSDLMDELRKLVVIERLVTLTGSGGSGKTRLALQVGVEVVEEFEGGVWFADLAALTDPALVAATVAAATGSREQPGKTPFESLADHLSGDRVLLVIDNCEHLLDACRELASLLVEQLPNAHVVATSRESLRIRGEVVRPVPPLAVPQPGDSDPQQESIRLFVERASAVRPNFHSSSEVLSEISSICRALDGIPLAIELAAARIATMNAREIRRRLDDRFKVLTGRSRESRHQTLEAAIAWSYDLLSPEEQDAFRRCSVFVGGFDLEALEHVLDSSDALDIVSELVHKSLLVPVDDGDTTRYEMLDMLRAFGWERLAESGLQVDVERRLAEWYEKVVRTARPHIKGGEPQVSMVRLSRDQANIRRVIAWLHENGEYARELEMATGFWSVWRAVCAMREGIETLERALSTATGDPGDVAEAHRGLGVLLGMSGEADRALEEFARAVDGYRTLGDRAAVARTLNTMGDLLAGLGKLDEAEPVFYQALEGAREGDDEPAVAMVLNNLGTVFHHRGDLESARAYYLQSLELNDRVGAVDPPVYFNLGEIAAREMKWADARAWYRRSLETAVQGNFQHMAIYVIGASADVALAESDARLAATLLAACEAARNAAGLRIDPDAREHEDRIARARAGVTGEEFDRAWQRGSAMSYAEAIDLARTVLID